MDVESNCSYYCPCDDSIRTDDQCAERGDCGKIPRLVTICPTPSEDGEDQVNSPSHYQSTHDHNGPIECIDAIKAMLGSNYKYYAQGVCLKYLWRHPYKGKPLQDLLKDRYYLDSLIEEIEKEDK